MEQSQDDAKDVALTRLGYTVRGRPARDHASSRCARARPRTARCRAGDQVLAVDGQPSEPTSPRSDRSCRRTGPASRVDVTYDRNGATEHRHASSTGQASTDRRLVRAGEAGRPTGTTCLGVVARRSSSTYHFPIDVKIDTQQVGGPVGRARVHAGDHRRPHARAPHRRRAGRGDRHHRSPTERSARSAASSRRRSPRAQRRVDSCSCRKRRSRTRARGRGRRAVVGVDDHRRGAGRAADGGWRGSAATVDDRGAIMRG